MLRHLAHWALLIPLAGCSFGVPLKEPAAVTQQERRSATIRPGESARADVRAAFGEPWLQSSFWGLDVYRASDTATQLGGLFVTIWPVPLGVFHSQVQGYVLVAYDAAGRVAQVAAGNAAKGMGEQDPLMLRARDLNLGIEGVSQRGPHLMADATRLRRYLEQRRASATCTVVLACDEAGHQKWPYESCPDRVVIDDAEPIDPQPFLGSCDPAGSCPPGTLPAGPFVRVPLVHAVTLAPGPHRLALTSSTFKGRYEAIYQCVAGEVRFGVIRGRVSWHWWGPRASTLDAAVTFEDHPPAQWSSYGVLLHRGGRWLVEPEPDRP